MKRRGSILVAVLLMASLLVVFVGVAGERLRAASAATRSAAEDVATDVAVRGAVEKLYAETSGRFASLTGVATVRYGQITVETRAVDEAGRIDLNLAGPELLAGIFRVVGSDATSAESLARTIIEWRRDPKQRDRKAGRASVPAHGIIEHFRELDRLEAIPRETLRRIEPFVTVAALRGKVAPLAAPPEVIAALPGMDPGRVANFLEERRAWNGTFEALMQRYGIAQDHVSKDPGPSTRLTMTVRIGSHRIRGYELVVAVLPGDEEPYRILSWNGRATVTTLDGTGR